MSCGQQDEGPRVTLGPTGTCYSRMHGWIMVAMSDQLCGTCSCRLTPIGLCIIHDVLSAYHISKWNIECCSHYNRETRTCDMLATNRMCIQFTVIYYQSVCYKQDVHTIHCYLLLIVSVRQHSLVHQLTVTGPVMAGRFLSAAVGSLLVLVALLLKCQCTCSVCSDTATLESACIMLQW